MRIRPATAVAWTLAFVTAGIPLMSADAHTPDCATSAAPHSYGNGAGPLGIRTQSAALLGLDEYAPAGGGVGSILISVADNNLTDCDGDGTPGDADGDFEFGMGGAFFGAGPWANEATCQYGLKVHGLDVTVTDLLVADVLFITAADDMNGPLVISDPINGGNICETDGVISPGEASTTSDDPTADHDDCKSHKRKNTGKACGTGGDGGYWVFLADCEWYLVPPPPGVECSPTSSGFVSAT